MITSRNITPYRPRLVAERKPIRPVQVVPVRMPVKTVKPLGHGAATIPAVRTR